MRGLGDDQDVVEVCSNPKTHPYGAQLDALTIGPKQMHSNRFCMSSCFALSTVLISSSSLRMFLNIMES
jgi:hypothetical protein